MTGKGDRKRRRALDAYTRLQRAAALAAAHVDEAVQPFGLSASQFGVLDTIATRGAVHQQELAEALDRSKAQMTAIIDALESRGLVRRERHAVDRRFITVHLTPAGRTVLSDATPARTAAIVALMAELTGAQRARLSRLCRRLLRALDPYEDDDGAHGPPGSETVDNVQGLLAAPPAPDGPNSTASTNAGTALSPDSRAYTGS
jgi:MarR family 2-MHQ and catechol resistance regulon transcriptional repressor